MKFNFDELLTLQEEKLIRIGKHEEYDLYVLNYSEHTQLGRLWDRHEALVHCRGLIVDNTGTVVAKPYKKFGNIGEFDGTNITTLAAYDNVEVTEKLDGSMIVLTQWQGKELFSTRSTFYSDQAVAAGELWGSKYRPYLREPLNTQFTYVWEYTSPNNRVVVRYSEDTLTLIGVIDTDTGEEYSYTKVAEEAARIGVPAVQFEDIDGEWQNLTKLQRDNFEGFVLYFPEQDVRVKIKLEEYLALHRIRSNMTNKFVYNALISDVNLEEMYTILEAEDKDWFTGVVQTYRDAFATKVAQAQELVHQLTKANIYNAKDRETRKAIVFFVQQRDPSLVGLVLDILDNREYTSRVWKLVKDF